MKGGFLVVGLVGVWFASAWAVADGIGQQPGPAQQVAQSGVAGCQGNILDCIECRLRGDCASVGNTSNGTGPGHDAAPTRTSNSPSPPLGNTFGESQISQAPSFVRDETCPQGSPKTVMPFLDDRVETTQARFDEQAAAIEEGTAFVNRIEEVRFRPGKGIQDMCAQFDDSLPDVQAKLTALETDAMYTDIKSLRKCLIWVRRDLESLAEQNPNLTTVLQFHLQTLSDYELVVDDMMVDGNFHRNKRGRLLKTLDEYHMQCDFL